MGFAMPPMNSTSGERVSISTLFTSKAVDRRLGQQQTFGPNPRKQTSEEPSPFCPKLAGVQTWSV